MQTIARSPTHDQERPADEEGGSLWEGFGDDGEDGVWAAESVEEGVERSDADAEPGSKPSMSTRGARGRATHTMTMLTAMAGYRQFGFGGRQRTTHKVATSSTSPESPNGAARW